ncbi:MAG: phosphoglycerate mutase family protein [Saprospiraceae bacterium]
MMRIPYLLYISLLILHACHVPHEGRPQSSTQDATRIILVRHAEKQQGDNPALTTEGSARAHRLAFMLNDVPVDAIFSSDFLRTRQTAAPLATAKGLETQLYNHKELPALVKVIEKDYKGKTVVVVGHSNSTPTLAGLLNPSYLPAEIDEADYSNVFIITLAPNGKHHTMRLRF